MIDEGMTDHKAITQYLIKNGIQVEQLQRS